MKKIVINPSHQLSNLCVLGDTEAAHCKLIAKAVYDILKTDGLLTPILIGDAPSTCTDEDIRRKWAIAQSNAANPDMHIGIHTNAGGGHGVEGIYYSDTGKNIAESICKELKMLFDPRNPLVYQNKKLEELNSTKSPACIIEIGFHDNKADATLIHTKVKSIAFSIVHGVYKYYGILNYEQLYKEVLAQLDSLKADLKALISKYK